MIITAGHRGDSPQFIPVLRRIRVSRLGLGRARGQPVLVLADRAYTSRGNRRRYLRSRGIKACIPSKSDQDAHRKTKGSRGGRPPTFGPQLCRLGHAGRERHRPPHTPPRRRHPLRQVSRRFQAVLTVTIISEWP